MAAILFGAATLQAQQLAFPGAEGFGRYATGGRTGSVYHVTNLNDDGPGSFRDAVSSPNRIVVFDVAGVIRINSRINVSPNLYIAGQTAPGEGVTIYGNGLSFSGANKANRLATRPPCPSEHPTPGDCGKALMRTVPTPMATVCPTGGRRRTVPTPTATMP